MTARVDSSPGPRGAWKLVHRDAGLAVMKRRLAGLAGKEKREDSRRTSHCSCPGRGPLLTRKRLLLLKERLNPMQKLICMATTTTVL